MTKLDEIVTEVSKESLLYGRKQSQIDFAKRVALEFAKHILEEAVENAEIKDTGFIGEDGWEAYQEIDKKSITDTLNKYL